MTESFDEIKKRINPTVIQAITRSGFTAEQTVDYISCLLACFVIEVVGEGVMYYGESLGTKFKVTVEVGDESE